MGFYRLFLAFVVAFSHIGFATGAFNAGEAAVVSFFLLSGFVMTALIDKHYADIGDVGRFYLDRALRLYPQFLLYAGLTVVAAERFGLRHHYMECTPSHLSDLVQMTMLPLTLQERFHNMLMPQAWSLSLELMFYAMFPFILISGKRYPVALWSAVIFMFGYAGTLNPDWFSYRLPPGVLFIFILGSWLYRPDRERGQALVVGAFLIAAGLLTCALFVYPRRPVVCDVLIGLVIGLPMLALLRRLGDLGRLDRLAGDLSYGVFLNHFLVLAGLRQLFPAAGDVVTFLALIPISTALSYASFNGVERPIIAWRRRLRPEPGRKAAAYPLSLGVARAA